MNVVVIEDERLAAERLVKLIKQYDGTINVIAILSSVGDSISWFQTNSKTFVDLVFMDIHLEDGDSFQIINQLGLKTPIIFTTAFDEYMIKAFKVNSIDYLLKPVGFDDLCGALDKFKSLRSANRESGSEQIQSDIKAMLKQLTLQSGQPYKERFMVAVGTKIRSVPVSQIAYFYLEQKAVLLVTFEGTIQPIDYSLDRVLQVVDPKSFFRINRQFIISINCIQNVHAAATGKITLSLTPKVKFEVNVSGDRASSFKEWLGKD